jgi:glucose/arabinose dehydrogenase
MLFSFSRAQRLTVPTFALASFLIVALGSVRSATAAEGSVTFTNAFDLTFDRPVVLAEIPGKTDEFLVAEQSGKIQRVVRESGRWKKLEFASFKVLGGKRWEDERGLLGLTFHPRFAENRLYYVNYVNPLENTVVEERRVREDGTRDSETHTRKILEVEQPYGNHNGGTIGFGPDGFLYIGMGDGGSGGDPHNYAQDPESLLGKMLRVNVDQRDSGAAYSIPRDNPFIRKPGYRPEIWALGLRNPWKWTFHPVTGSLWVGDVGQGEREEISIIPRGGNMGWRVLEADRCFEGPNCVRKGFVPPVVSLSRAEARSVTGGEFYLGNGASQHYGAYIFGDYKTGHVWSLRRRSGRWDRVIIGNVAAVSAFARDARGDVYALGLKDGVVWKVGL